MPNIWWSIYIYDSYSSIGFKAVLCWFHIITLQYYKIWICFVILVSTGPAPHINSLSNVLHPVHYQSWSCQKSSSSPGNKFGPHDGAISKDSGIISNWFIILVYSRKTGIYSTSSNFTCGGSRVDCWWSWNQSWWNDENDVTFYGFLFALVALLFLPKRALAIQEIWFIDFYFKGRLLANFEYRIYGY